MNAKECGRDVRGVLCALTLLGTVGGLLNEAHAQFAARKNRGGAAAPGQGQPAPAPAVDPATAGMLNNLKPVALPVNPTDPIIIVNNEVITRQQLADECIARKGKEIGETLVARKLIEQALRANKLEVTATEIDQEIDKVAMQVSGLGREAWLRTLDKERGISPVQYARDIIYPALALRKLSAARVQVTPLDMRNAFEAQYGDKLRCRMIMVDKVVAAKEIWEELRKNPGGFEKMAMERSMDASSRSLGGLLGEPISRHAYPQTVSDAAFYQLVDGDAKDQDKTHKPKDGDISGPIQVAESTWIILRREGLIPGQQANPNEEKVKKQTYDMIYEVKLKEAMGAYMVDLMQKASIDNKLTGQVKLAEQDVQVDQEVKLMGGRPNDAPQANTNGRPATGADARLKSITPAALSPEVAKQAEGLTRPATKK